MSTIVKAGTTFYPSVDSDFDVIGKPGIFSYKIVDLATGSEVTNAAEDDTITEVVYTPSGHSATTNGVATAGSRTITVASGHDITADEVIDDGAGNKYYVISVTDTTLTLKRELVADIPDQTTINTVGNTGIYRLPVKLESNGKYMVIFEIKGAGRLGDIYEVVTHDIDDVAGTLQSSYEDVSRKLDDLGARPRFRFIS